MAVSPELASILNAGATWDLAKEEQDRQQKITALATKLGLGRSEAEQLLSPQQVEQKTSPTGFAQKPMESHAGVIETLNAPIDYVADQAGRGMQNLVDPNKNPILSDIAGGLTKAAIQYAGPQGLATGARVAAKGAMALSNQLGKVGLNIPGVEGGQMASAIDKTRQSIANLQGPASQKAFELKSLTRGIPEDASAPLPRTLSTLQSLIAKEEKAGIKNPGFLSDAKELEKMILSHKGQSPIHWIDNELSSIGEKTKTIKAMDGASVRPDPRYKQLFSSMVKDLESTDPMKVGSHTESLSPSVKKIGPSAAKGSIQEERFLPRAQSTVADLGKPYQVDDVAQQTHRVSTKYLTDPALQKEGSMSAGSVVRQKDYALRREAALKDLRSEFEDLVNVKRATGGAQDINGAALIKKLKDNESISKYMSHEDWKEVEPLLTKLADMSPIPPARGVNYGSGRALARGAIFGGAATLLGANPYLAVSAATAADFTAGHLLMSKGGRTLVKSIIDAPWYSTSQKMNIINGMGRLAEKGINQITEGGQ